MACIRTSCNVHISSTNTQNSPVRIKEKMSKLIINKSGILNTTVKPFNKHVNNDYYKRMRKLTGEHYRFLTWLGMQFKNEKFYDLGTRAGASAMCLGYERSNKVISYDITDELKIKHNFNFTEFPNIEFRLKDIAYEPIETFLDGTVILLDIDHSGKTEKKFFDNLCQTNYNGILIMDDINYYKFKELGKFWKSITKPKYIVDIAHHSGTGIVPFGDWEIEIVK